MCFSCSVVACFLQHKMQLKECLHALLKSIVWPPVRTVDACHGVQDTWRVRNAVPATHGQHLGLVVHHARGCAASVVSQSCSASLGPDLLGRDSGNEELIGVLSHELWRQRSLGPRVEQLPCGSAPQSLHCITVRWEVPGALSGCGVFQTNLTTGPYFRAHLLASLESVSVKHSLGNTAYRVNYLFCLCTSFVFHPSPPSPKFEILPIFQGASKMPPPL